MRILPNIIYLLIFSVSTGCSITTTNNNAISKVHPNSGSSFKNTTCKLFPFNNVWNTPINTLPIHPLSSIYIASIDDYSTGRPQSIKADFGTAWWGI